MTFIEFLEWLRIYGPLGLWAGLTSLGCWRLYRDGHADAIVSATQAKTVADAHAAQLIQQTAIAGAALETQIRLHHEQLNELTDRFVTLHEQAATENRELTHEVRALIEVVSRKRGR